MPLLPCRKSSEGCAEGVFVSKTTPRTTTMAHGWDTTELVCRVSFRICFLAFSYKPVTWMLDDSRLLEGSKCVLELYLADTEL